MAGRGDGGEFFFFSLLWSMASGSDGGFFLVVAWVLGFWWLWYGWWVFGGWLGLCGEFVGGGGVVVVCNV